MKLEIDTVAGTLRSDGQELALHSARGFEIVSGLWLTVGWGRKYSYGFSWLGVPIIQLPEDMVRFQEVVARLRPDVIVECGVAHGGSAVFSASLCRLLGHGRVIAVDIDIRPHNRARLEAHPLSDLITLLQGSSTDPEVVEQVRGRIEPGETVLVVLDSDHSHTHVMAELDAYSPMVTPGSYIVATDGVMQDLADMPGGKPAWADDNPARAARDFAAVNPAFVIEQPAWPFNESGLTRNVTYWPQAWLKRVG